ncbi:MAG: hypothetical protein M1821_001898 [Bathelium mastoideum]|nr:MAG: hypothetical protein M1821_001898 [Bathelium mastoideum]
MLTTVPSADAVSSRPAKYKAACVPCGVSKVKCPGGGPPCERCATTSKIALCHYRLAARIGKPLGSKNKKTLGRLRAEEPENAQNGESNEEVFNWVSPQQTYATDTQQTSPIPSDDPQVDLSEDFVGQPEIDPTNMSHCVSSIDCDKSILDNDLSLVSNIDAELCALKDFRYSASDVAWPSEIETYRREVVSCSFNRRLTDLKQSRPPGNNGEMPFHSMESTIVDESRQEPPELAMDTPLPLPVPFPMPDSNRADSLENILARIRPADDDGCGSYIEAASPTLIPCQCLCKYTSVVCQLQRIEKQQRPVKADTFLSCTNSVISTSEAQFKCDQCTHDSRVLLQLVIIIQTILSWVADGRQRQLCTRIRLKGTLGQHRLTEQEAKFMTTALIFKTIGRIQNVIKVMADRVEQMGTRRQQKGQSQDNAEADIGSLQHWMRTLVQMSNEMVRSVDTETL